MCWLLAEQWSFCHFPSVSLLCPSQSWLSTGIWSPRPSAGHEWDSPEILWQFWRVLHHPQTWLTCCLSHLYPKSNDPIWLTHWRIPTHLHCFLDWSSSMRELQPFFIHTLAPQCSWGEKPFLESWMCFISDALLRHILAQLCKACQQIWKACISPIKATFLSSHHLSHAHRIHPCLPVLTCDRIFNSLNGIDGQHISLQFLGLFLNYF